MVNTRFNNVGHVAPVNVPAEDSIGKGHHQGKGRGIARGRGRGRVKPTRDRSFVVKAPRNEISAAHLDEMEENVEVEEDEIVGHQEEV